MSEQIEETKQAASQGGSSGLKAAVAAAAAAGAAAMIARKALSGDHSSNGHRSQNGGKGSSRQDGGMFGSIAAGGFDAARDALGPAAEDAAGALGKFVAQNAPEIVTERIVPRFIESFNQAREK